jgi:hypothetical protein
MSSICPELGAQVSVGKRLSAALNGLSGGRSVILSARFRVRFAGCLTEEFAGRSATVLAGVATRGPMPEVLFNWFTESS